MFHVGVSYLLWFPRQVKSEISFSKHCLRSKYKNEMGGKNIKLSVIKPELFIQAYSTKKCFYNINIVI